MSARDYGDDPMKALVRKYDAAVVTGGGTSLFTMKRSARRWNEGPPRPIDERGELPGNAAHNVSESVSVRHAQQHGEADVRVSAQASRGPENVRRG